MSLFLFLCLSLVLLFWGVFEMVLEVISKVSVWVQSWEEPGCGLAPGSLELADCSWLDRKVSEAQFKRKCLVMMKWQCQSLRKKNPCIMEETKTLWDVGTLCHICVYSGLLFLFFVFFFAQEALQQLYTVEWH